MPRENTSNQIRNLIPYLLNNYPYYYSEYSQTQKNQYKKEKHRISLILLDILSYWKSINKGTHDYIQIPTNKSPYLLLW